MFVALLDVLTLSQFWFLWSLIQTLLIQELVLIMISAVFQRQEDKQHDFTGHIPALELLISSPYDISLQRFDSFLSSGPAVIVCFRGHRGRVKMKARVQESQRDCHTNPGSSSRCTWGRLEIRVSTCSSISGMNSIDRAN